MAALDKLMVAPPSLVPRLLLGLNTDIKGNVQFLSDEEVTYPVGSVLAIHNLNQKKQKYIKLPEKGQNVNIIAVSPNKRTLALCEEGEKPSVTLYDPTTYKKKKQIMLPPEKELTAKCIEAVAFSADSKSLFLVVGDPDWLMLVYKVEKAKLDTLARANNSNNTGTVVQICPNINDGNLVVLIGNALYRNLTCSESVWRQFGWNKAESVNLVSACWLSQDRLLAGSSQGKIMFLENGELKRVYHAFDATTLILKDLDEQTNMPGSSATNLVPEVISEMGSMSSAFDHDGNEVCHLTNIGRGFLFSFQRGCIHFFERITAHKYVKKIIFRIPDNNTMRSDEELKEEHIEFMHLYMNEVNSIAISPSEDRLLVTCHETQIYTGKLFGNEGEIMLQEYGLPMHHGPIGALAVCTWKPIFMTTGIFDRTLRVWNYENETLELFKKYQEDIFSCDLHPTGFFAAVGFADKLRVLKLMMDDFVCDREYPIRGCKLVKYSKLGHLFAAINGNVIQVYSSVSYEHMFNLKGHNGLVTGLSWVHDDYKLASCGTEGAVYEWQISTTRRICETILKVCQFSGLNITNDGKSSFAVGSDGRVREIVNSNVYNETQVCPQPLDCMVMSNSDGMLFTTGNNGVVYTMLIPMLSDNQPTNEFIIHSRRINAMQITYDDKHVITTSPSCICIWKIVGADQRMIRIDKEFSPSTVVMIERNDLIDKLDLIRDLQVRMNELQTEHAYQMRQTEATNTSLVKEIHETYQQAIDELKEKNENLELEHNAEVSAINMEISKMKSHHEIFVQKLEANYNEKLIVEYDKFMLLEEKLCRMRMNYDKELEDLAEAKRVSEETITNSFNMQLRDKGIQLEELLEKINLMTRESETTKQQIEEDADREIYEIKSQYEKELREEQDLNVRLRGETQSSKKKLQLSQKNIDDLMHTLHTHEIEQHKLKTVIFGLEQTISDLKKEIIERDLTIQDKEKRIAELKHKNQELEKFKFILEFKIDELKAQIEPRDRTIREQTEQITDMVNELENLQKIIQSLELQLTELREKLKAADNETKREVVKNRAAKASLKRIKTEIHYASGVSHDVPRLQKSVREMYHKYNADKDFAVAHAEDTEAKKEFLRQRDFLERTVRALKSQVNKAKSYTGENLRLVEQNSQLITETNNLRKSLKMERKENKRMSALLGCKANSLPGGKPALLLDMALATKDEIRAEYIHIIEEDEKAIVILQSENARLRSKVTELMEGKEPNTLI